MPGTDRLTALCAQNGITGIDFVQVDDPGAQTLLRIFFILDPDEQLSPAWANVPVGPVPQTAPFTDPGVSIASKSEGIPVEVVSARWLRDEFAEQERTVLEIETAAPGDFSLYVIHIDSPRIDPFFNDAVFSFKQGCPSRLDCKAKAPPCPDEALTDFPVDYLARDFTSIRNALLDFAAQRYPNWKERIEADPGVMLAELMAAMGDEFSYLQDQYAKEAHFESANQRRSLRWHSSLIDYLIHDGLSADTLLAVNAIADGAFAESGMRVWGITENGSPMPFELGNGLRDSRRFWIHEDWNEIPVHVPDDSEPCLPIGSTQINLVGEFPLPAQLPAPAAVGENDDDGDWIGRPLILRSRPSDPSLPVRTHVVTIESVEALDDLLYLDAFNNPIRYTRVTWNREQATPFELHLPSTVALANVVTATAGETVTEYFIIGRDQPLPNANPESETVGRAVEREGAFDEFARHRPISYLYSLKETESRSLGWLGELRRAKPEIELREIDATTLAPLVTAHDWEYARSLLDVSSREHFYTLENGIWKTIFEVERFGEFLRHEDYFTQSGFSLRFGDGEFGVVPPEGTSFRVRYRTDVGEVGNLPADTISFIADPKPPPAFPPPPPPPPTLAGIADRVTNPFAIATGIDPEDAISLKLLAPEAFRAETYRAVRDEDYRERAERVPGVQKAGARARWTGSWLSEFVTVDPEGAFTLSEVLKANVLSHLNCVRQVGREVFVRDPVYLDLDLDIEICVKPSAYAGQVIERVVDALTIRKPGLYQPQPFFHPDQFTFGTPLYRSALEAAVQDVSGVLAVESMEIRVRGHSGWRAFTENVYEVSERQILRLQNDRRFPERGSLIVRAH